MSERGLNIRRRVVCDKCASVVEYDISSKWEGNRDFEDIGCPECGNVIERVFTDFIPQVCLIKRK